MTGTGRAIISTEKIAHVPPKHEYEVPENEALSLFLSLTHSLTDESAQRCLGHHVSVAKGAHCNDTPPYANRNTGEIVSRIVLKHNLYSVVMIILELYSSYEYSRALQYLWVF